MVSLDPDDPRPPYKQVANALRAAILTKKFEPGEKLPSGTELAKTYGVARMTVQQAIRLLRDEGLVSSRQGSGVFVRERTELPVELRPHLERAFDDTSVSIDFAGFSGETLAGILQEPLDKVRIGRLTPDSITIRILLPDLEQPMLLPCLAEDLTDDSGVRERALRIMLRSTQAIADGVHELADLGLVKNASVQIRTYAAMPSFKLYLINHEQAFFGFYPVVKHTARLNGERKELYDVMGKDSVLFHYALTDDPSSTASQYVAQARAWFNSMWTTISRETEI
ncbi:GntR family transcriptional regulator [Streptosporangium sp. 'caverna']|uniref:GntR family transcriptional regulator n=1 Tax=Streptosporangium sp. 'caverna' TaxID=2202249 RepID=UPI000D7DCF3C|nr:GntR family transcriptional regulator [Streptosporangium sp. 'caverna']AWS42100.1 GntR family transcriptional regulator [Streptosporangium sp. 'caverna']